MLMERRVKKGEYLISYTNGKSWGYTLIKINHKINAVAFFNQIQTMIPPGADVAIVAISKII